MTFLLLFLLIYGLANLYIGWRNLLWLQSFFPVSPFLYWTVLAAVASSPIAARVMARSGYVDTGYWTAVGDWWLAVTYWSVLIWLLTDLLRFVSRYVTAQASHAISGTIQGITVNLLIFVLLLYGSWNALQPVVVRHEITVQKQIGGLGPIKAVMVSDIHIGRVVDSGRVQLLADMLIKLNPDIVFYVGDIIDDDAGYAADRNLIAPLATVKPRLGSYAVLGNHEYIGGQPDECADLMVKAGITVLRDRVTLVQDLFYVAGREELSASRYGGKDRKSLAELLTGLDPSRPLILLDHHPLLKGDPVPPSADLQLSGHSHRGQFFPNNLITSYLYETDWGLYKKEAFHLIVSSGYGTWGPPVRIGTRAEIVEIMIHYHK